MSKTAVLRWINERWSQDQARAALTGGHLPTTVRAAIMREFGLNATMAVLVVGEWLALTARGQLDDVIA